MIPHSVAYLEMFLQSVRNGAAPLQIPSDDILTEKIFCNPARHRRLNHAFEDYNAMLNIPFTALTRSHFRLS